MEKNLYDTNKLIELYKNEESVNGYTTILNVIEFPKALELDLRVLYPSKSDYRLAIRISTELLKIGKPIPEVDILISAIAINNGLKVVTKDKHFLLVKDVMREFDVLVEY
jgi:predicted nucleic acid-binding protein